jgi:hypothetical protein
VRVLVCFCSEDCAGLQFPSITSGGDIDLYLEQPAQTRGIAETVLRHSSEKECKSSVLLSEAAFAEEKKTVVKSEREKVKRVELSTCTVACHLHRCRHRQSRPSG